MEDVSMLKSTWVQSLMVLLMYSFLGANLSYSQDPSRQDETKESRARFELEEVVVTATGIEDTIKRTPRNVTVITREDIEQAPSNNVVDLLSREANVNLQSFFGHDKNAGVDIRGQGVTAVSNVLVLVDGFRLNPPDLAGPDLSSVPLDQIERIEIVRGAGSVLYGDGAVGGVINIITKKGETEPEGTLRGGYGSYETIDGRGSVGGKIDKLSYNLNAGYYDTDGYRQNGFYGRGDGSGRLGYDLFETTTLSLSATYKDDEQGFPGGVPLEDIDDPVLRRKSRSPNDRGETTDWRLLGVAETDLSKWGIVSANGGYRSRRNDFIFGFTPLKSIEEQLGKIREDTATLDLFYKKDYNLWEREQLLRFGANYYYTDYFSERPDQLTRKNGLVNSLGVFFFNQGSIRDDLTFNLGYRYNSYDGEFRDDELKDFGGVSRWVNGVPFEREWDNNAVDLGIVYSPKKDTTLFASYATSFRVPNVDELALAVDGLRPQEGQHIDIGARQNFRGMGEVSLTLFQVRIEDEIFFDNVNRVNRNFEDKTRRRGVEVDVRFYPTDSLYIWGNYTYMKAKFETLDTFVPLVPKNTASLGLEWRVVEPLLLALTGSFVDEKFDGDDLTNNRFAKIKSYTVVDGKLTYTWKDLKIFFGVNNIFDEFYETLAFSETYFTMPTRNYYGGVEWRF